MDNLDFLKLNISKVPDEVFNEIIPKAVLKLSDSQIETVSFIFWFCYMAETELMNVLSTAWKMASGQKNEIVVEMAKSILKDAGGDIDKLDYFSEKIKVFEAMCGKNERTKILWKLSGLRNDIGHNRIDKLFYNGEDLHNRTTQEKLLIDYHETADRQDLEKSSLWSKLTPEEKKETKRQAENLKI